MFRILQHLFIPPIICIFIFSSQSFYVAVGLCLLNTILNYIAVSLFFFFPDFIHFESSIENNCPMKTVWFLIKFILGAPNYGHSVMLRKSKHQIVQIKVTLF